MTDTKKDASDAALELLKQLITLSSGVLALSATFILQFSSSQRWPLVLLVVSWGSLVIAIISALTGISAIVKSRLNSDEYWSTGIGRTAARTSRFCFVGGIVIFALFAVTSLIVAPTTSETRATVTVPAGGRVLVVGDTCCVSGITIDILLEKELGMTDSLTHDAPVPVAQ